MRSLYLECSDAGLNAYSVPPLYSLSSSVVYLTRICALRFLDGSFTYPYLDSNIQGIIRMADNSKPSRFKMDRLEDRITPSYCAPPACNDSHHGGSKKGGSKKGGSKKSGSKKGKSKKGGSKKGGSKKAKACKKK